MNYYYGLERTDKLGIDIFIEALLKNPKPVIEYAFIKFDRYLIQAFTLRQIPTFDRPLRLELDRQTEPSGSISLVYPESPQSWFFPYYNPEMKIKRFGPTTIDNIAKFTHHLPLWITLSVLAALAIIFDAFKSVSYTHLTLPTTPYV